jgi:phosphatidylglycerol:prolipoprotein diacylglycerol transferase
LTDESLPREPNESPEDTDENTEGPARRWSSSITTFVSILVVLALLTYAIIRAVSNWRGVYNPTVIRIGPLSVGWYGVLIMSGALGGAVLAELEGRRRGYDTSHVWNLLMLGLVTAVVVSRLTYVLGNWAVYSRDIPSIFGIEDGRFVGLRGLTIHGAFFGAVLAAWLYTWRQKLSTWVWLDLGMIGFLVGQAVGRWGNFFNQEAYGWRTTLPWGLRIAAENRLDVVNAAGNILPEYSKLAAGSPVCDAPGLACYRDLTRFPFETTRFHPTFLYESLWNAASCLLLIFLARRYGDRMIRGEAFFLYGILYATGRFANEFLRVDSEYLGSFPAAQIVSVGLFVVCATCLVVRRWFWKPTRRRAAT